MAWPPLHGPLLFLAFCLFAAVKAASGGNVKPKPNPRWCGQDNCRSFSQFGEEQTLFSLFFHKKQNGVFLEIGALDGLMFSNTFYLETGLNWTGRLIEGNRKNFDLLRQNVARWRVRSTPIWSAVCEPPATHVNFTTSGGATSGADGAMAESFKKQWHSIDIASKNKKKKHRKELRMAYEEVPCAPMSALMANMSHIDFWSLDVEGAELQALNTVDFGTVQIDVISVELDQHNPPKNVKARRILRAANFTECRWGTLSGNNALFVSRRSPYSCAQPGVQPCICGFHDCKTCKLGK